MTHRALLTDYIKVADMHAVRLKEAKVATIAIESLLTPTLLPTLSSNQVAFLDMLSMRFSKLQDLIGAKLFPITLDLLGEDAITFIDKLHKLERIGYLYKSYDSNWWMSLREIRNQLNHDYPDDYNLISEHLSMLLKKASELLEFWEGFKNKIIILVKA